jgi:tetraacyldisaccharide 4'-kinase
MKTPIWFNNKNLLAITLLPLSVAYFFVSKIIFTLRLFRKKTSKTPVICIGGLLAGGVGKTPIVREVAKYLNAVVVMRGYHGKNRQSGVPVKSYDSSFDVGDEAKMLAESGLTVYVGNRSENIEALNYKDDKVSAIIMDDGFQNPKIKKDISIIVFDESVGIGNGFLLPAGPMREPLHSGIKRCDAVLINQSDFGAGCMHVIQIAKKYKKPVFFVKKDTDTTGFFGKYVAFAGIGYPEKFFESLRNVISMRIVKRVAFSDHHSYTKDDIINLFRLAKKYESRLICTEKDWVKLPHNIQAKVKYVPLKITIQANFFVWLEKKLGERNERFKD